MPRKKKPPEPIDHKAQALADQIAADLFTSGFGFRAERLVLWSDTENRDYGGWCERAVIDRIYMILAGKRPTTTIPPCHSSPARPR